MAEATNLLKVSAIKALVHNDDLRIGADALALVNEEVEQIIAQAVAKALEDKRKTILRQDISY